MFLECSNQSKAWQPNRKSWVASGHGELFAPLCVVGFANGSAGRVQVAIAHDGLIGALVNTFNISAVVWAAFVACPVLLLGLPKDPITRKDWTVAACAAGAFLLPIPDISWIALTGLAFYLLQHSRATAERFQHRARRSAWILLATTSAMYWGRVLLMSASDPILGTDALLISWLTGTDRAGNTVRLAEGQGYIWIAPGCSSLSNISLAILCWALFTQVRGVEWSVKNLGWCLLACLAVIAINISRIGVMAMHPDLFDLIHGPVGASLASWLTVAAVVAVCLYGTRRDRLAYA